MRFLVVVVPRRVRLCRLGLVVAFVLAFAAAALAPAVAGANLSPDGE